MEFLTSRRAGHAPAARPLRLLEELESQPAVVASAYGHRDFWTRRFLAGADAVALIIALAISAPLGKDVSLGPHVLWGLLAVPLGLALLKIYGLYERDAKRVSHGTVHDIPWIFHAVVIGVLLLWVFYKFLAGHQLVLDEVVVLAACLFVGTLAFRFAVRSAAIRILAAERVLLVGADEMTKLLARKMRAHPEYGLDPIGVVTLSNANGNGEMPVLGRLDDLADVVVANQVDRIVVSPSGLDEDNQLKLLRRCRELSLKVGFLPHVFDVMGPSVAVDDVEGVTLLGINPPVLSRSSRLMKRLLDVTCSAA